MRGIGVGAKSSWTTNSPFPFRGSCCPALPGLRPKQPVLLDLSHDAAEPGRIQQDLQARYGQNYRLARASSAEQALEQLTNSKEKHESVALMLVNQALPAMNGTEFLAEAATYFPEARKVLIATAKDTEAAITGINQLGIHHYLVLPWRPESILPILDELLDDWQATVELSYLRVKGIMETRVARIRADSNLHHAAEIVAMSGVSDLMVVDHNGDFVGVLSEGDILRAALPDFDEILEQGGALRDAYQAFLRKGRELSQKPDSAVDHSRADHATTGRPRRKSRRSAHRQTDPPVTGAERRAPHRHGVARQYLRGGRGDAVR